MWAKWLECGKYTCSLLFSFVVFIRKFKLKRYEIFIGKQARNSCLLLYIDRIAQKTAQKRVSRFSSFSFLFSFKNDFAHTNLGLQCVRLLSQCM